MPTLLSGSSLIVVMKNSCGTFMISDDTSVSRLMSCSFCSFDSAPLSTVIYGIFVPPFAFADWAVAASPITRYSTLVFSVFARRTAMSADGIHDWLLTSLPMARFVISARAATSLFDSPENAISSLNRD